MQKPENLKEKVSKGIMWGALNTGVQQILNFIIGIFLARLLTPEDYGMVGVLTVFTALAGALQEGGFISALTNRKNATHLDYMSVFWFSTGCSLILYVLLFFLAPLIAEFYEIQALTPLSRFIFLGFVFSSLNIAPRAALFKNLNVKDIALIAIISLSLAGVIGITLSFYGAAYWGLAAQTVSYTGLYTLLCWIFTKWKPRFIFSFKPIKEMFGFSSKLLITNIFNVLNSNIFSILLGKFYSAVDVGQFNQANKWNGMGYSVITGIIYGVAQPSLATISEDSNRQTRVFRKLLRFTAFISFPLMFGLSLVAPEFITITIGEKWIFSSYILRLLCIWGAFYPISYLFSNLLLSQGRSKAYMWITIALAIIQISAIYFSYPFGLYRMIYVFIAINLIWIFVWLAYAKRKISLPIVSFLKDVIPFLAIAVAAYLIAAYSCLQIENIYAAFFLKLLILVAVYLFVLWILKAKVLLESLSYLQHRHP